MRKKNINLKEKKNLNLKFDIKNQMLKKKNLKIENEEKIEVKYK